MHGRMGTYGVPQGPMWKIWDPKRSYGGWALMKSMGSHRLLFWEGDLMVSYWVRWGARVGKMGSYGVLWGSWGWGDMGCSGG